MSLTWSAQCVRYLLFIFNLCFVIVGIVILSVGVAIKTYYTNYEMFLDDQYFSAANLLIAIGVISFLIAFFGCCGAVKENYCMTVTYSTLLVLICILELAAGIAGFVLHNETEDYLEKQLKDSMKLYNTSKHNATTQMWDEIQKDFDCCGVKGPTDWKSMNNTDNKLPMSCCTQTIGAIGIDRCDYESHNLRNDGCVNKFGQAIKDHAYSIGGIGIGFGIVQVMGIIFACHLSRKIRDNYETV